MSDARLTKVLRDLWLNRGRMVLIILAIAVGIFAVGVLGATAGTLSEELPARYREIDPAHIVFTTTLFESELAEGIARRPGIAQVEARRMLSVRLLVDAEQNIWRDLFIFGIEDFKEMRVYRLWPVGGDWPPPKGSVLMERGSLAYLGLSQGQEIVVRTPEGKRRTMPISGLAHDLYHMPAFMEGTVYAYATRETIEWLGAEPGYNTLYVRVEGDPADRAAMNALVEDLTGVLEGEGLLVFSTFRPRPDSYPLDYIANTVLLVLGMLGSLILALGCFLIINTITALMAQQARQIGVIKALGGTGGQVAAMYLGMVALLGVLGTALALPFSALGARELIAFIAGLLNFDVAPGRYPAWVAVVQVGVGVLLPLLAAMIPIAGAARRSPALALSEYGRGRVWSRVAWADILLGRLPVPLLFAARNPFRRRLRLFFSLAMLTLAGSSFITVLNLNGALQKTVEEMIGFWQYDLWVTLDRPSSLERLQQTGLEVADVRQVEGWGFEMTRRTRPDGSESNPIFLFGVDPQSDMVKPLLLQGRWLDIEDEDAVVIGMGLLNAEPDLRVGGDLNLKVNGKTRTFRIVGVIQMLGNQTVGYTVYVNQSHYSRLAGKGKRVDMAIVRTQPLDPQAKRAAGAALEQAYERAGLPVSSVVMMDDERLEINAAFSIVVTLLLIMVLLLAFTGGLGLMGTMSLNVIERSREIGVVRAFGGSNDVVFRIVVVEGVLIGVMSWVLSLAAAIPLTWVFCDLIGRSFLDFPLAYVYSPAGALLWLGLVAGLAALASLLPAGNAVRLTVREVLSFE